MKNKDSNKTSTEDKFKKLATKNFWTSVAVYIFFGTSILASFHNFITADKKSNSIWATILVVLVVLFMVMLFLMRLHGNHRWQELTKEAEEEAREEAKMEWAGRPAEAKEGIAYKVLQVLESRVFLVGDEDRKVFRVISWMIEDDDKGKINQIKCFPDDKARIFLFYCSDDFLVNPMAVIKLSNLCDINMDDGSTKTIWQMIDKLN